MSSAYLLVSHGSRDPRPQVALERLAGLLQGNRGKRAEEAEGAEGKHLIQNPSCAGSAPKVRPKIQTSLASSPQPPVPLIGTACLELSPTPLHQQIAEFSDRALACGHQQVQLLPLFLLPGVHVMEDIPAEVAIARQTLKARVKLELNPHLGSHAGLVRLLQNQLKQTEAEQTILLAHGSRRVGSGHPVEAIARQLGAVVAYWSVAPSLGERVQELAMVAKQTAFGSVGRRRIAIIPYFLFAGGITDAIAEVVEQLQSQFPAIELSLMEPLGATQELADLIWDLVETEPIEI
jgi:sirohydrochlorin cobaltochelatase